VAYNIPWSESQPDGSEAANTLDTEIQQLKESIRERMNNILSSTTVWQTDAQDPKLLKGTAFVAGSIPYIAQANERAVLSLNSNEVITTATATPIPWDNEDVDVGGLVDLVSPTRITIVNTGFYLVVGSVLWAAGSTGDRLCYIRKNGASTLTLSSAKPSALLAAANNPAFIGVLTAADYLQLFVEHSEGSNLEVVSSATTHFAITRIA
jgi:hypothetical protein